MLEKISILIIIIFIAFGSPYLGGLIRWILNFELDFKNILHQRPFITLCKNYLIGFALINTSIYIYLYSDEAEPEYYLVFTLVTLFIPASILGKYIRWILFQRKKYRHFLTMYNTDGFVFRDIIIGKLILISIYAVSYYIGII